LKICFCLKAICPINSLFIAINAHPTYYAIGAFNMDAYKKLAKSFETGDDTDKENKFD